MTNPSSPVHAATTRRQALQWALALGAGSFGLASCGGSDTPAPTPATPDTLPEAPLIEAQNGLIDLELRVAYARRPMRVARTREPVYPGPALDVDAYLRGFNGQPLGPTLVLKGGDMLRLRLVNDLPDNTPQSRTLDALNYPNSTNLHFHGLHVDPREIRPGVFGDYVVDHADGGIRPGASRQHEIAIPAGHSPGVNWYHPHLHGSSTAQVASGLFGAILVRDPGNRFAPPDQVRERVVFVHKTPVGDTTRTDVLYDTVAHSASDFLLNGAYQPTLVLRPGEVQQWHFINSDTFYPFSPVLDEHTLWAYARDGNVFQGSFKALTPETAGKPTPQTWPGNDIYPGGRHSVLVQASRTPGTYLLRNFNAQNGHHEIVARVVVEGEPLAMALPTPQQLPVVAGHAPITDEEMARGGGLQRELVLAILSKDDPQLAPVPAGEAWAVAPEDQMPFLEGTYFVTGIVDGGPLQMAPFHSALTPVQTVGLGTVEEWTVHNLDVPSNSFYAHPFHIHVNDSCVVKVNGEPVAPYWADTLPIPIGGSITFRMRFTDFAGAFVWHCHALDHEDMGMMQMVRIV